MVSCCHCKVSQIGSKLDETIYKFVCLTDHNRQNTGLYFLLQCCHCTATVPAGRTQQVSLCNPMFCR